MIAPIRKSYRKNSVPAWHAGFLTMLPAIANHARICFRRLDPEAREEGIQEAIANATVAYARLCQLGKADLAYPTVLARYAVAQVSSGRKVGNRLNVREVLSKYAQRQKGIVVERLDHFDVEENTWKEAVVVDTRLAPVPDIVSFRVDFSAWLGRLPRRDRRIAESLAIGNRTGEVAGRFKVTAARISQLRRELATSWWAFVGEGSHAAATATA
jgi:hypothetical protein